MSKNTSKSSVVLKILLYLGMAVFVVVAAKYFPKQAFYLIISLGILVFIHELGHFIFAKRGGIFVEAFSLGFGPRFFGVKYGDTDYRICALPLGGYVKMMGEDGSEGEAADPRSFAAKSVWVRAKVILFGPLMNLFLCLVLMPIIFMIGRNEPIYLKEKPALIDVRAGSPAAEAGFQKGDLILEVGGEAVGRWDELLERVMLAPGARLKVLLQRGSWMIEKDLTVGEMPELKGGYVGFEPMLFLGNEAVLDSIKSGGPADLAGIKAGDQVLSFAGKPVSDWIDLSQKVDENKGVPAPIVVKRAGEKLSLTVTPTYNEGHARWLIGISKERMSGVPTELVRYAPLAALKMGMKETVKLTVLTLKVLKKLVTLKLSFEVLGGPIMIAKTSAMAAGYGFANFLYFLAFLSLNLAILNFLPFPILDGGHLVYLAIEAIWKRPLAARVRSVLDHVGLALLVTLMLAVTFNDLRNVLGLGEWLKKVF